MTQPDAPENGHLDHTGTWHPGTVSSCLACLRHQDRLRRLVKHARRSR